MKMLNYILLALIGLGVGTEAIVPCADCEYHFCEITYPMQGMPVYSQPVYSAAGQLFYNFAPKIYPIHIFQIAGNQRIAAVIKVLKPGILSNLVVDITNLGAELECTPMYSFEAFALFTGVPPGLSFNPIRALPCARNYMFEIEIAPTGNLTEYTAVLKDFAQELLQLRKVGIILDMYKFTGRLPATFLIFGCGTPTFFDQLTLSFGSMAEDYGAIAIGRVQALTKWNPLIGGKGGSCFFGMSSATMFPTGKK